MTGANEDLREGARAFRIKLFDMCQDVRAARELLLQKKQRLDELMREGVRLSKACKDPTDFDAGRDLLEASVYAKDALQEANLACARLQLADRYLLQAVDCISVRREVMDDDPV